MIHMIILGIVQGIAEWIPISSEGLIILIQSNLPNNTLSFDQMIETALVLHFGTLLSALVYFRREVVVLLKSLVQWKTADVEQQKTLSFLIISTLISGGLGIILIKTMSHIFENSQTSSRFINAFVGICLLWTAWMELRAKRQGYREPKDLTFKDSLLLGIAQGFAALPGLSRSGLTVSTLLLRHFHKTHALRLSFLMSMPIVLAGNIVLHITSLKISLESLAGVFTAFIFGLATIHLLLKIAEKVNFGILVMIFGILMILSIFV
jgi:undecaprenyl-diphosphatase